MEISSIDRTQPKQPDSAEDRAPILVVDDDPEIQSELAAILELEGYPVETVSHGAEALRAVERFRPALVLLDLHMPFLDGRDFIQALKERDLALPVILMTGDPNAEEVADEIDADAYLAKPFDLDELFAVVQRFVDCPPGAAAGA